MKEILESIILNIVEHQDQVVITTKQDEKTITLEVKVAESDMGKVIGKQGRVAKAIRTIMKSVAVQEHRKIMVDFKD